MTPSAARLRVHLADPMHRDGYSLVAGTAITTGLGMLFWIVAARRFDPHAVGVAAALISAMSFLANLATLGLRNGLIRFLPRSSDPAGLIRHAYLWSGLAAMAAAGVFLLGLSIWTPDLAMLRSSPWASVGFIVATVIWLLFVLQDAVLTGIREARWVPVENGIYAVAKLVGLLMVTATSAWAIFVTWVTPAALLVLPVNVAVFRVLSVRSRAGTEPTRLRPLVRFAATDHAAALLWLTTTELVPLVLLTTAGATAAATYYMVFTISYSLYLITSNVSSALVVEASLNPETAPSALRRAARQAGVLVVPAALMAAVLAPWILKLLGPHYEESGTSLLRLMLLSAVPYVVVGIAIGRARVRKRLRLLVLVYAVIAVTVFSAALLAVPQFGLVAMGWAWLGSQTLLAALLAPTVFGAERSYGGTLLAWAGAVRAAPQRNRRARAWTDLVRSVVREAGLDASAEARLLPSENDVVVSATRASGNDIVVRVAVTPSGDAAIERSAGILEGLASDPRTRGWDHAPRLVALVSVNDRRGSIETLCPGLPVNRLSGAARAEAMAATLSLVAEFHHATSTRISVDQGWCRRHVDDPIGVLERVLGSGAPAAGLQALRVALRGELEGRMVSTCVIHGDLWAGNVVIAASSGAAPRISLIDWEDSVVDGLPEVDMAHAWLAEQPEEMGPLICRVLRDPAGWPGSRDLDGVFVAGDSDLPVRVIMLMAWLRHASGNLLRTTELKPTQRWLRANVLAVLEEVERLGARQDQIGVHADGR